MKKQFKILILFAFLYSSLFNYAQIKKRNHEKIRAYKVAFLTEKLNLTENEAQKFWPIYNEYNEKTIKLHKKERYKVKKEIESYGGIENISEKKAKEILEQVNYIKNQQHNSKVAFFKKLSKILPAKKILTFQIAEHEFNRKLMTKLRGRKNKK